ncbi:MAG: TonB-dependent receptor [Bacteroidales bacterium]|nr:TonB-dependent receptor [Candidatus Liminaster caballi]
MKTKFNFRFLALALAGIFVSISVMAQDIVVKGVVDDTFGDPVTGANVVVKGTSTGSITDLDGAFTFKAPKGSTLVVSFIGYQTQEVPASENVHVTLSEDSELLEDVVVIGYGVARKNDMTGSVTAIKPDAMNKGLVTTAQDALQGKIAGVNITNSGGAAGGSSTIRIRGGSSLNASNDPLIVIDGLAMDNYGLQGSGNALSMVNPADIESFTVLKDASATAIYGSRASNGVIIITTKKGTKNSRPRVSYNGNVSISAPVNTLDVMSSSAYQKFVKGLVMEQKGFTTDAEWEASDEYKALGYYDAEGNHLFANTDWQDEIYRTAISTDQNITVTGGLKNMPYRVSIGYTNQNGILKTNTYERYTASVNVSPSFFNDHLKLNINAKGMLSNTRYANGAAIGAAIEMDPTKPVYDKTPAGKQYGGYYQWPATTDYKDSEWTAGVNTLAVQNPVAALNNIIDKGKSKAFIGNIEADYKIHGFEDLHLHVNAGTEVKTGKSNKTTSIYTYDTSTFYYGNKGWTTQDTYNNSLNMYAQYVKDINKAHHIDVMAGYEWQHFHKQSDYFYCGKYPETNLEHAGEDYKPSENTLYKTENYLVSFFGRLNYSLLDRYLVTFTLRDDGSSRFSKDNRWGLFPSAAFAWKVNEESFLKNVNCVSDAKVRLGWGVTGQQEGIGDYTYIATYTPNVQGAYYPILGEGITYRPDVFNDNLTWEQTTTYNAGIDLGFWDDRLVVNLDYYYRKTKDLINSVVLPVGTNFGNKVNSNIGSLHNEGVEAAFTWRAIQRRDWRWELGFNATWNKNEIDELIASNGPDYKILHGGLAIGDSGSDGVQAWMVGHPVSAYYVYQQVYDEQGQPIRGQFVDRNGDGEISEKDRYFYKKSNGDLIMGLTSKLMYKNWDFCMAFRASINNYVYNGVEASTKSDLSYTGVYSGLTWHNRPNMVLAKGWNTVETKDALSDYFIQNASYLKCDNITLGYSFDKLFGAKISGRAFVTAQNVFTITNYKGLDPEIDGGYDGSIYPRPFTGIVGLSLNF